jgi:hypothetical protein
MPFLIHHPGDACALSIAPVGDENFAGRDLVARQRLTTLGVRQLNLADALVRQV